MEKRKECLVGLIAGINGGVAVVYVGQPLDTIKIKMQAFPNVYKSAITCFKATWLKDGLIRGLYAGTVPALVANVAENSVVFCSLPLCQTIVATILQNDHRKQLNAFENACAGSLTGFFSSLVLCPTELIKCKMQAYHDMVGLGLSIARSADMNAYSITKQIMQNEGFRGLYRGFWPTLAREMFGYFFFFGGYEFTRDCLARYRGVRKNELGHLAIVAAGGVGGMALWTAIFPFDVVKSRIQIGYMSSSTTKVASTQFIPIIVNIVKNEGFGALYRGISPTLLRTIPATGALFLVVEWTRKLAHKLFD